MSLRRPLTPFTFILVALAAIVAGPACAEPAARVIVTFESEAGIRAEANEFRLQVNDRDGVLVEDALYMLVDGAPAAGETALPYELTLEPRDDDATSTYELVGTLFDPTGAELTTQRARGSYVKDEGLELRLVFDDACANAICDYARETCQNGACYEPCVVPTPLGALGDRRSPPVSCPETRDCPDGEAPSCVAHGPGEGVHTCESGVHVIRHCDAGCVADPTARCM